MILSWLVGLAVRLVNALLTLFPPLGNILAGFASALLYVVNMAMPWNWLLPISDTFLLAVRAIQFEFGIAIFLFFRWLFEMIRGK